MSFLDEFAAYEAAHGTPERIELLLCDINAILRGKWLPGGDAAKLAEGRVRLPVSTYAPNILGEEPSAAGLGIAAGDPDGAVEPVPDTLRPIPWLDGNAAQVQIEMAASKPEHEGLSSRGHLASMAKRFEKRGLGPVLATEMEFYLLKPRATPSDPPEPPQFAPDAQNYELDALDRTAAMLEDIQASAAIQRLPTDALTAEYGPGQFEINFRHTEDALAAADHALLFRRLVRGTARKHGMRATFMAKPYAAHPGNGMHVHASVLGAKGNIFSAEGGMAGALESSIAGVLATMEDAQALFAPHLNSFRRFAPGGFAPNRPDWGVDNRAAAVRVPEAKGPAARLEHRIAGADANPYLALTAILGGILHGIDASPPLPAPLGDPSHKAGPPLTHDWRRAVDNFAASEFVAETFGTRFRGLYAAIKSDEINKLTSIIAPVEYRMYLDRL